MKKKDNDRKSRSQRVEESSGREPDVRPKLQWQAGTWLLTSRPPDLDPSTLKIERTKLECL